jgi:beta-N-acetylhexosaminidase
MTVARRAPGRARVVSMTLPLLGLLIVACGDARLPAGSPSSPSAAATDTPAATESAPAPVATSPTDSPSPSPTPTASTVVAPACTAQARLELWPIQRMAWQLVVVPAQLTSLSRVRAEVASGAGGVLLFGATAPADLAAELSRLESTAPGGIAPVVMSDIEGGNVERAANLLGPMPSARQLGQTMTPAQIQAYALRAGRRMHAIGIAMDLAPVMDLDAGYGPTANNPDGTRSFSADPHIAAADSSAFAAGLSAAGVVPVGKHFPGLHGAGDNTDLGPAQTWSWSLLQQHGLLPFTTGFGRGLPAVMLSNASVPGLSTLPSSISPQVVGVLRGQLGFTGLILTDSLTAGAITKIGLPAPSAMAAAVVAGADMVLYDDAHVDVAATARAAVAAIGAAVSSGRLSRAQLMASVSSVLAAKHIDLCAGSQ